MSQVTHARPLHVLLIEDASADAFLIERTLLRSGIPCRTHRVDSEPALRDALETFPADVILSDYTLPGFDGMRALAMCRRQRPDIPVIFVSGTIGEERAIAALLEGAADYVLKTNLVRLPAAVERALREARERGIREAQAVRIAHLTRILNVTSAVGAMILRTRHRHALYQEACRVAVALGGFRMAWIALPDAGGNTFDAVSFAGHEAGFLASTLPLGCGEQGHGTAALLEAAARTARPAVDHDLGAGADPVGNEMHGSRGYRSGAALPLVVDGRVVAILVLYAAEPAFFDVEEIRLLTDLAGDLGFALDYLDKRERLAHLAYFDALTGVANRDLFRDRLGQQLHGAAAEARPIAVVLFDLERFRDVNETLGRPLGDALLRQMADRLVLVSSGHDAVGRIGSDCFAALFLDTDGSEIGRLLRDEFLPALARPYDPAGTPIRVAVRAGIAVQPGDGQDPDTLLRNAETALHRAKLAGLPFMFYTPEMHAHVARRLVLENRLRLAVEQKAFVLHYQRKVDLRTGRTAGVEALLRWHDAEAGLVAPRDFIPLLEETGLIRETGAWILGKALADRRHLIARGLHAPRVAVNVSALQLRDPAFVETVIAAIARSGDANHGLDLEITESVIMDNSEQTIERLRILRGLGVRIAIDDFGTGYSSLAYLSRLPVDTLKIDQSFVRSMVRGVEDRNIVSTIISLAHLLALDVVAEGVETEAERAVLQTLDCDGIQGFLVSHPMPLAALEAELAAER